LKNKKCLNLTNILKIEYLNLEKFKFKCVYIQKKVHTRKCSNSKKFKFRSCSRNVKILIILKIKKMKKFQKIVHVFVWFFAGFKTVRILHFFKFRNLFRFQNSLTCKIYSYFEIR
jgi:hypothetical protein